MNLLNLGQNARECAALACISDFVCDDKREIWMMDGGIVRHFLF